MLTDSDIIRILSDERLDRKILATIRRALRAPEEPEHVSESDKPLPTTWGMIPIRDAAKKYGVTMEDIAEGITALRCKGNDSHVDEESFRLWHYDGRKRGLPPPEVNAPGITESDAAEARDFRASLTIPEAAAKLGLSEEAITDHILAGSLKAVGDDRVAERSVLKYLEVLQAAGAGGRAQVGSGSSTKQLPPASVVLDASDVMTTAEAAEFLGIAMPSVSAMASRGLIAKIAWGKVSRASVLAYKARRDAAATAHATSQGNTPPPVSSTSRTGEQVDASGSAAQEVEAVPSMTVVEAAAYLGRSTQHVHVDAAQGRLVRAGRGKVTRASVEALYTIRKNRGIAVPEHEAATV